MEAAVSQPRDTSVRTGALVRGEIMSSTMCIQAAGATHPGRVREKNEDAFLIDAELGLCVVADGMGGHAAGEVAAQMAVEEVARHIREAGPLARPWGARDASGAALSAGFLAQAVQHANKAIHIASRTIPGCENMGTTVAAALFGQRFAFLAHAGDSRIYRFHAGMLDALTEDDSLAAVYLRAHGPAADRRWIELHRNRLTRCLGTKPELRVTVDAVPCAHGDTILMCTDGLWGAVDHASMASLLGGIPDPQEAADALIAAANAAGGPDNVTAVVVRSGHGGA